MRIVIPGVSSEVNGVGSADGSPESPMLEPDDQEVTPAPRSPWRDVPLRLEEFTDILVDARSLSSGSDRADPPELHRPDPSHSNELNGKHT